VTQLPGYQQIPLNCPLWKKAMIEKKNKQLEEDAMVCITLVEKRNTLIFAYLFGAFLQATSRVPRWWIGERPPDMAASCDIYK